MIGTKPLKNYNEFRNRLRKWLRSHLIALLLYRSYLRNTTSLRWREVSRVLLPLALTTVLLMPTACSSVSPLDVQTVPLDLKTPPERAALPNPRPLQLQTVKWVVLTPDNLPVGDQWVFMALTPEDFERLALNNSEITRWVEESMWRLKYYREEPAQ